MKKDVKISLVENGKLSRGGWLSIVAFLLVAVIALSVALGLVVKAGKDDKAKDVASVEAAMPMPEEENTGRGISLLSTVIPVEQYDEYGIAPMALSAYKITATVKVNGKDEAPDFMKGVTWQMAWKSSVASAVTEYVTMTDSEDSATFACKKPFSTQIVVTVKSKYDPSQSATATLDYRQKVTGVHVKVGTATQVVTSSNTPVLSATFPVRYDASVSMPSSGDWVSTSFFNWFGNTDISEGTLSPSSGAGNGAIKIVPSAEFQAKYNAIKGSSLGNMVTELSMNKNASSSMITTVLNLYQKLTNTTESTSLVSMGALQALSTAIAQTDNQLTVTINVNGSEWSYTINITPDSLPAVSVDLDNASIIFE